MFSVLGAFASVRARVVGSYFTGHTVVIVRHWMGGGDVLVGTDGTMICITGFFSEVPIFLAFVAAHQFL